MLDRARAIALAADGLRPQTERALRAAAPAGVERDVRVKQVADEVVLDREIAPIHVDDVRQRIHVLEDRAIGRVPDAAVLAEAESEDVAQRPALGHFLDREVELVARDEVDGRRRGERFDGVNGHVGPDEPDPQIRIPGLHGLGHLHVGGKGRRARVQDRELVRVREGHDVVQRQIEEDPMGFEETIHLVPRPDTQQPPCLRYGKLPRSDGFQSDCL